MLMEGKAISSKTDLKRLFAWILFCDVIVAQSDIPDSHSIYMKPSSCFFQNYKNIIFEHQLLSSQFSLKQCAADTSTLQSKRDNNFFQYLPFTSIYDNISSRSQEKLDPGNWVLRRLF